ncbi:MAG TPA: GAF domain-containing sensor histidine kinase [Anaerolineae bacterium]|nr:GAF domain-containing sensor histidine kinase [Anaerolineae bacterium]
MTDQICDALLSKTDQETVQRLFQNIDLSMVTEQSLGVAAQGLLNKLCHLIPCDQGSLILLDFETDEVLQIATKAGLDTRIDVEARISLAASECMAEWQDQPAYLVKDLLTLAKPSYLDKLWQAEGARTLLTVPLRLQNELIGALNLGLMASATFSPAQLQLARDTASQMAVTVGQAWLLSRAQTRARELASLNRAAQAITSSLDLNTVLEQIMAEINTIVAAEGSAVLFYDPDRDDLVFAAAASPAAEVMTGRRVPVASSIAGWCAREKRPAIVENAQRDPRFFDRIDLLTGLTTHSILCVPLVIRDDVIGVIETTNKINGAFNQHDLELLKTLASSAASAIENARLFEQVQAGREQLRHLTQQVVEAQEEERRRLSYILHDESGQALIALKMKLELMQMFLPSDVEVLRQNLREVIDLADTTMERLRTLARDLRPPALDAAGLDPTLAGLCREFAGWSQLTVDYKGVTITNLSEPAKICLYRLLQEALTNVAKHAQAQRVWVKLATNQERVSLSIKDDGQGFEERLDWTNPPHPKGIGLTGIQERLDLLGGQLEIFSQLGKGTALTAHIPLEGQ